MAEGLDLQLRADLAADLLHFLQAALSCQDHTLGAEVIPGLGALIVGDGLLGGDVTLAVGGVLARQGEGTQISKDQGVHTGVIQLLHVGGQVDDFVVAGHGVDGDVDLDAVVMGVFHRHGQLLRGEVTGEGAHAEAGTGQVHSVGAVENGHFQPFHISGGGEKFKFCHINLR